MSKEAVLFVCIHNSARSQMAEEWLRKLAGDRFAVQSAGLEPGNLNPVVVKVLQEDGIDITGKATQSTAELIEAKKEFDYVITVCDETSAEACPHFPGRAERIHWGFADPSGFAGSEEEKLAQTRLIRDEIKSTIEKWLESLS